MTTCPKADTLLNLFDSFLRMLSRVQAFAANRTLDEAPAEPTIAAADSSGTLVFDLMPLFSWAALYSRGGLIGGLSDARLVFPHADTVRPNFVQILFSGRRCAPICAKTRPQGNVTVDLHFRDASDLSSRHSNHIIDLCRRLVTYPLYPFHLAVRRGRFGTVWVGRRRLGRRYLLILCTQWSGRFLPFVRHKQLRESG